MYPSSGTSSSSQPCLRAHKLPFACVPGVSDRRVISKPFRSRKDASAVTFRPSPGDCDTPSDSTDLDDAAWRGAVKYLVLGTLTVHLEQIDAWSPGFRLFDQARALGLDLVCRRTSLAAETKVGKIFVAHRYEFPGPSVAPTARLKHSRDRTLFRRTFCSSSERSPVWLVAVDGDALVGAGGIDRECPDVSTDVHDV